MKKKILIVEDELHLQKLVASTLEEAGYEVLTASDGEMGLKILEDQKPDLLLLDLILAAAKASSTVSIILSFGTPLSASSCSSVDCKIFKSITKLFNFNKPVHQGRTLFLV